MKIITEDSLPRCFKNHPEASGLVYEDDIGIGSKLKLKLLVFWKPAQKLLEERAWQTEPWQKVHWRCLVE